MTRSDTVEKSVDILRMSIDKFKVLYKKVQTNSRSPQKKQGQEERRRELKAYIHKYVFLLVCNGFQEIKFVLKTYLKGRHNI